MRLRTAASDLSATAARTKPLADLEQVPNEENGQEPGQSGFEHCDDLVHGRPNGLRLSGDGGEADGVRCSRGLDADLTPVFRRSDPASYDS